MTTGRRHHPASVSTPRAVAIALAVGLAAAPACGSDGSPPPPRQNTRPAAAPKKPSARGKNATLQFYDKIEDFAEDDPERETIRHKFTVRDFDSDVSGVENRDPFQSYVIRQPGITQGEAGTGIGSETPICTTKDMVATSYSLRDLRLIGIVLRGTRSYALFRDRASFGHIVRKGDCLGQEKARVSAIGSGFVTLELIPDGPTSPDQPLRPQERSIQLYPEELQIEPDTQPGPEE